MYEELFQTPIEQIVMASEDGKFKARNLPDFFKYYEEKAQSSHASRVPCLEVHNNIIERSMFYLLRLFSLDDIDDIRDTKISNDFRLDSVCKT